MYLLLCFGSDKFGERKNIVKNINYTIIRNVYIGYTICINTIFVKKNQDVSNSNSVEWPIYTSY